MYDTRESIRSPLLCPLDPDEMLSISGGTKIPWGWPAALVVQPFWRVARPTLLGHRLFVPQAESM